MAIGCWQVPEVCVKVAGQLDCPKTVEELAEGETRLAALNQESVR